MAFTDPNNLIDPELLLDYVTAQFGESNKFIASGLINMINVPGLNQSSSVVEIPQWDALDGMQTLNPGDDVNTAGLNDHLQRHPVTRRYKGVLNLDIAAIIAKGDPNQETARQINKIIDRAYNQSAIATLQGATAANTANVVADTGAAPAVTDLTALEQVFGDILPDVVQSGLWVMRSAPFNDYRELGLVADPVVGDRFQDDVVAGANMFGVRGSILGRNVIVDDELYRAGLTSKTTGDALTYLVGNGAILSADQRPIKIDQDYNVTKQGDEIVFSYHKSLGLNGMDYTATVAKKGPEDSDLRNSSNYSLVAEDARFVPSASIQTNHS